MWVANLENFIVRLDVFRAFDCVINARGGTLTFLDGEVVQMSGQPSRLNYTVNHQITILTTESVDDTVFLLQGRWQQIMSCRKCSRPSTSPGATAVVVAQKRLSDGWRFSAVFKTLNQVTKKDPYYSMH